MKKSDRKNRPYFLTAVMCTGVLMLTAGCDKMYVTMDELLEEEQEKESGTEEGALLQILPTDTSAIAVLEMQYGEEEPDVELAAFLAEYFEVPQDMMAETRYYYDRMDLNEDGTEEIVVVVLNEELENSAGHPLLILQEEEDGTFAVITRMDEVHTPVVIDNEMENGWHKVIPMVYGGGTSPGYMIYHYEDGGYQTGEDDFVEELTGVVGVQILSDNFIDDLDRGEYLTLLTEP